MRWRREAFKRSCFSSMARSSSANASARRRSWPSTWATTLAVSALRALAIYMLDQVAKEVEDEASANITIQ